MSLSEQFHDLDPKVARALSRAVEGLRSEFRELLSKARGEWTAEPAPETTESDIGATTPSVPAEVLPALAAAPSAETSDVLEELKHAVAQVDRATTQGEILESLLTGARRFSSRAALFLLRSSAIEGWDGSGFEGARFAIQNLELDLPAGSAWARLAEGRGGVPLDADDCGLLCDAIGVERPAVGVLLPLVLGDRIAAALYGDVLAGNGSLNLSALQLLTFNAGQLLETLPVRNRAETVTLKIAKAGPAEPIETAPDSAAKAAAANFAVAEPAAAPEPEIDLEMASESDALFEVSDEVEPEVVEEKTRTLGPIPPEPVRSPAETATFETVAVSGQQLEELRLPPLPELDEPLASATASRDALGLPEVDLEPLTLPAEPEPARPTPPFQEPALVEPEVESSPRLGGDTSRTSTLVEPPSDVQGPGWAFTHRPPASEVGEEALHEEARRLARLLVTEIKLYNEEQVDVGRQQRDLYGRLREDIERSRQIYTDRIDEQIRDRKDYFQEALVRILAGGDSGALGV
jgi:hypothetical protein